MKKPENTVNHIFAKYFPAFLKNNKVPAHSIKAINALTKCRTEELGGHWEKCEQCKAVKVHYNSCGNRHCPSCQGANRERWILEREKDLFDAKHFHVTFTIPFELRPLFRHNKKLLYKLLFDSVKETLKRFSEDKRSRLQAKLGVIAILHTWTQKLEFHPHIHCIVPAGGLTEQGHWKAIKSRKFLFSAKAMSMVFKAIFCQALLAMHKELVFPGKDADFINPIVFKAFIAEIKKKKWVVHSKQSFNGARQVLEYLGRYTHKIAVSNYRIKAVTDTHVTFSYRDRKDGDTKKEMTLEIGEFMKRFLEHILPARFVKIRHFGYFSSRTKKEDLKKIKHSLGQKIAAPSERLSIQEVLLKTKGIDVRKCPCCKTGSMVVFKVFHPRRATPRKLPLGKITDAFKFV